MKIEDAEVEPLAETARGIELPDGRPCSTILAWHASVACRVPMLRAGRRWLIEKRFAPMIAAAVLARYIAKAKRGRR